MSTSGNITGVYDIAGGAWEYVQTDSSSSNASIIKYLDYTISNISNSFDIIGQTVRGSMGTSNSGVTNLPLDGGADSRIGYRIVLHISE